MIKFNCKTCGQKIDVPVNYAGKKGKCPKCQTVVIVPGLNEQIFLKPLNTDNYSTPDAEPELRIKKDTPHQAKFEGLSADGMNVTNESILKPEIKEQPPQRPQPWLLDIFLYPSSRSGLINFGIFWLLPVMLSGLLTVLPNVRRLHRFGPGGIVIVAIFIVISYMFYYLMECIRDSASGTIRAPENIGSMPDIHEASTQFSEIIASVIVFWSPVCGYLIYKVFWQNANPNNPYDPASDWIFWLLLGYGIFFFPIGILASAMFNSTSAFNPFLWIASIFSTFFQYCGLVIFFCMLAWLLSTITASFHNAPLFSFVFWGLFVYLAMVTSHLLGRFYYLNSDKLNWDV